LQALGAALYVVIIAAVMYGLDSVETVPSIYLSMITVLLLLVFSAAVTGSLIFAYPAVLAVRKKIKQAFWVLGSTLGWMVIFLIVFLLIILV